MKTLFSLVLSLMFTAVFAQLNDTIFTDVQGNPMLVGYSSTEQPETIYQLEGTDEPFSGVYVIVDSWGEWREVKEFTEGKQSGEWKRYKGKSNLIEVTNYHNGKKDGLHIKYQGDTELVKGKYENGEPVGEWNYTNQFTNATWSETFTN